MCNEAKKNSLSVKMSKKELIKEHTDLVKDLRSGSKKKLAQEVTKQSKELKQYKK